jgi:hypothetical protein
MPDNVPQTRAVLDVLRERFRQINDEGWSPEHDDAHIGGELAIAAAAYAAEAAAHANDRDPKNPPDFWPWEASWWKPSYRRRDLVKAAALIIAEIERLDRTEEKGQSNG